MKNVFTVKVDDKDVELKVVKPNLNQKNESDKVRNKKFREALDSGAYLKKEIVNVLRKRGEFSEEEERQSTELQDKIEKGLERLNEGGFEIEEAKKLAFDVARWRMDLAGLMQSYADMSDKTAEGQADNAAFDYLVSCCVVYNNDGKPFFKGYEDYLQKKDEQYAEVAAGEFFQLMGGVDIEALGQLPEYQFLKEFGFVNDKLQLVNENGELVDDDGRRVDEDGYYLNDEGERVDRAGNKLDENNRPILKRKPFTKDGKPLPVVTEKKEEVAKVEEEPKS